jgi:hypothetical protein
VQGRVRPAVMAAASTRQCLPDATARSNGGRPRPGGRLAPATRPGAGPRWREEEGVLAGLEACRGGRRAGAWARGQQRQAPVGEGGARSWPREEEGEREEEERKKEKGKKKRVKRKR